MPPDLSRRTALPVSITEGRDLNGNSDNNDLPAKAYAFDGFTDDGTARVKEIGDCKTYNCGRGAARTQFNLRGSKAFMVKSVRIEAIAEVLSAMNGPFARGLSRCSDRSLPRLGSRRVVHLYDNRLFTPHHHDLVFVHFLEGEAAQRLPFLHCGLSLSSSRRRRGNLLIFHVGDARDIGDQCAVKDEFRLREGRGRDLFYGDLPFGMEEILFGDDRIIERRGRLLL